MAKNSSSGRAKRGSFGRGIDHQADDWWTIRYRIDRTLAARGAAETEE